MPARLSYSRRINQNAGSLAPVNLFTTRWSCLLNKSLERVASLERPFRPSFWKVSKSTGSTAESVNRLGEEGHGCHDHSWVWGKCLQCKGPSRTPFP